jgi:hypothetical protein
MEEDEEYRMPDREVMSLISEGGFQLIKWEKFRWRLNNVSVAEIPA